MTAKPRDTTFRGFDLEAVRGQGSERVRATATGWIAGAVIPKMRNGTFRFNPDEAAQNVICEEWAKALNAKQMEERHVRPVVPSGVVRAGRAQGRLRISPEIANRTEPCDEVFQHFVHGEKLRFDIRCLQEVPKRLGFFVSYLGYRSYSWDGSEVPAGKVAVRDYEVIQHVVQGQKLRIDIFCLQEAPKRAVVCCMSPRRPETRRPGM